MKFYKCKEFNSMVECSLWLNTHSDIKVEGLLQEDRYLTDAVYVGTYTPVKISVMSLLYSTENIEDE